MGRDTPIFNVEQHTKSVGSVPFTREALVGVFNRHDKNNDGRLSKSELKEAFEEIGSRCSKVRASLELHHADKNHNGFIDKGEFEKLIDHVLKHNYQFGG
ncbi:hypothetical protein CJ030_MR3G009818 [Morella rubra]|uniref:EF-hand domain-containing protein n=1 Tax=Morella rubra TaxID=262757 RepID=A0A6A1W9I7_9ROSI|nr:hypothetical protein CJ030_MR3G009818 [Morella rubra]